MSRLKGGSGQRWLQNTQAVAISSDKLSETTRNLLGGGAILVKDKGDDESRLYVLPDKADEIRAALTRDCFAGTIAVVPMEMVYLTNPVTYETNEFARLEILPQYAAMIANGVERTQKGERNGIANTLVLQSTGGVAEDIDLHPKAFELLANGESLVQLVGKGARDARDSGFGGIGGK